MDDLAFLRERIESYAGYTNDDARRLCDEQIRAYVGESLARLFERLKLSGTAAEPLARTLLRCQFADQTVVRAFDFDTFDDRAIVAIHAVDRRLVVLADDGDALDPGAADAYAAQVDGMLDRRSAIVLGQGTSLPETPSESSRFA